MQSQIDGLVAINSSLRARLDDQVERQAEQVKELGEKYNVLESRCGSLERSIKVLRKDVSWSYSAPDIPRSHWIEQGRDEEYAAQMEECLERIKEEVERIRNGENIYCGCLDNEDWPAMANDDALLPHFKELADAIQLSNGIQHICIDNIELRPSTLGILFPTMEGKAQSFIVETHMDRNQISSDEQSDLLIESVIENRVIKRITLSNCFNQSGADGRRALATLLTCGRPFEWLDFGENYLSGIDDVAAALATNPQLEKLLMTGNQLNDSDAELIAQALKQNTNLRSLYLDDNNITSTGFEKIRTALYDSSSLNAMESCNHTCYVDWVKGNDIDDATAAPESKVLRVTVSTTLGQQQCSSLERRVGGGEIHDQACAEGASLH
ncbi:hypothetical protein THAOC_18727 [Thalassiosira oceanica]|uniref:Uncharacterized protein n=1 Tax=Thalassiosira oceanica TaxID=159749 RepID=K0S7F3_THAOC|nr:hypothetical protein THAOC_18727 [Thalassiosira oceanica]|eukprot:EJK60859.1 hypothetical protein THAOC_18727 [Thalassiosira oceanica]